MDNKALGRHGEELAVVYLEEKGLHILEKNFRNKIGEIDLIAQDGSTLCFVEVKTRRSFAFGKPFESVHYHKQQKIIKVAICYLKYKKGTLSVKCRFDVISIYKDPDGKAQIHHIKNAFGLPSYR